MVDNRSGTCGCSLYLAEGILDKARPLRTDIYSRRCGLVCGVANSAAAALGLCQERRSAYRLPVTGTVRLIILDGVGGG